MTDSFLEYEKKRSVQTLKKLTKFVNEKGITRAQLIAFMNRRGMKATIKDSNDDLMKKINDQYMFAMSRVLEELPKIKAHIKPRVPTHQELVKKYIEDNNVTRAAIVGFLRQKRKKVFQRETLDDLILRISKYKMTELTTKLPKLKNARIIVGNQKMSVNNQE